MGDEQKKPTPAGVGYYFALLPVETAYTGGSSGSGTS